MSRKVWLYLLSACNCMHAALATKLHIVTYKFQVRSGFQVRNCVLKRLIQLPSAHNACQILVHSVRRAVQTVATTHSGMVEQGAIVISCFTTHRLGVFVHAHKIFLGVVAIIRGHEIAIVFFGPPSRAGDLCRRHQHSLHYKHIKMLMVTFNESWWVKWPTSSWTVVVMCTCHDGIY